MRSDPVMNQLLDSDGSL